MEYLATELLLPMSRMSSPSEPFSRLSLGSMPPNTRSQSRLHPEHQAEQPEGEESESDDGFEVDEAAGIATFPSGLKYSLDHLAHDTRKSVMKSIEPSSKLVLRTCQSRGEDYLFLLSETIEFNVRMGTSKSRFALPSCSCHNEDVNRSLQQGPCRHTLWLCDQITSQMRPRSETSATPYALGRNGFPENLGNMCDNIPDFKLDVLADSLRCDVHDGQWASPSPRRVQTAREILATVTGTPVDSFRPDLTGLPRDEPNVQTHDLEGTIFRMLLCNSVFFTDFLSDMRSESDLFNLKFRRFRDRADAALAGFDEHVQNPAAAAERTGGPRDKEWCARRLVEIQNQIEDLIFSAGRELSRYDQRAAARTLVHILRQVTARNGVVATAAGLSWRPRVEERNLYDRLISQHPRRVGPGRLVFGRGLGSRGNEEQDDFNENNNFILGVLERIPPRSVSHLVGELDEIEQVLGDSQHGAPERYRHKLRAIRASARSAASVSSSSLASGPKKRAAGGDERVPKRMK
ncbi:hypothetical protein GGR56DRAFT_182046 [Xylariaceae sp. FL0804]|nr:hypothetical protein GGR56DRAFT_182046 [Xylariaceae sp. FL0804]